MAEYIRPIWKDKIYGGDGRPKFDVTDPSLPQIAPVIQEGTHHVSGRMNNLFVFDNLIAMSGTEYKSSGWLTSEFTETITETEADEESGEKTVVAKRMWTETAKDSWLVVEDLYDINEFGQNVVVQKRMAAVSKADGEWTAHVV